MTPDPCETLPMQERWKSFWFTLTGILISPFFLSSCELDTGPDTIFIDTPITVEVLEGLETSDSVEARVPVRVSLVPDDDETPTPLRLQVRFQLPGEDCGTVDPALGNSDSNDEAATIWTLGTLVQECTMEVHVFSPAGTTLGFVGFKATIENGQPTEGGLIEGQVERAVDTLFISLEDVLLSDRFGNEVPWRMGVVDGPAVVLGEDISDDRSRTLVATGEGSGNIDLITDFGAFVQVGFNVCTSNDQRWIRVFRQEDADMVLGACP